mgnify:CR=1 FL=1
MPDYLKTIGKWALSIGIAFVPLVPILILPNIFFDLVPLMVPFTIGVLLALETYTTFFAPVEVRSAVSVWFWHDNQRDFWIVTIAFIPFIIFSVLMNVYEGLSSIIFFILAFGLPVLIIWLCGTRQLHQKLRNRI